MRNWMRGMLALLLALALLGAVASAEEASAGIPEDIADRELFVFFDPRYAESLTFRSDGSFWWAAEGETYRLGSIDAVRQASASVYALRIGELDPTGADAASWLLGGSQPGDEILVALPNADPSELNGNLAPTVDQDYNGYETEYEPADYYIGTVNEGGELWFEPFEYWDFQ